MCGIYAYAQTPYDSFHPETTRPMLRLERDTAWRQQTEDDNGSFLIVANHNSGIVMLYDLCGDSLVAVAELNPKALMWLSVDPMADNNIHESPYVYCGGRPINKIDPTGLDDYDIDMNGNVVNQTVNKERDAFFIVDSDGNRIDGKQQIFAYGTIEKYKHIPNGGAGFDLFEVRGDQNADELFEFLANNTTIEWSLLTMGATGNRGLGALMTSHQADREEAGAFLLTNKYSYGYFIRGHTHNHPNNTPYPSGLWMNESLNMKSKQKPGDIGMAKYLHNLAQQRGRVSPLMQIYISICPYYIQYDANSTKKQFGL